jgi:LemA protein
VAAEGSASRSGDDENRLVRGVNRLLARIEAYPELRASAHFRALQHELVDTEDRIAAARRFYNDNTREYNVLVRQLPSALIATLAGYQPQDFFEIEDLAARAAPRVSLDVAGRPHGGPPAPSNA